MRNCRLTVFFIWISGSPFVQHSVAICAILVEGNEEKFCEIILNLGKRFRSRCCLKDSISGALVALLFSGAEPFMQF